MGDGLKRARAAARATRRPANPPYRVVESEDGDGGVLHAVVPNHGLLSLVWDDEFSGTAYAVCRGMKAAYLRGRRDAKKSKARAREDRTEAVIKAIVELLELIPVSMFPSWAGDAAKTKFAAIKRGLETEIGG